MIANRRLVLVRHCESAVNAASDPSTWGLTTSGASDARRLAQSSIFARATVVAAGDEPKMVETVRPLASRCQVELTVRDGLRESASGGWVSDTEFKRIVRQFLEAPSRVPAPGWESADQTVDRLLVEIEALAASEPIGDIVVCTGGRALTATLGSIRHPPDRRGP